MLDVIVQSIDSAGGAFRARRKSDHGIRCEFAAPVTGLNPTAWRNGETSRLYDESDGVPGGIAARPRR